MPPSRHPPIQQASGTYLFSIFKAVERHRADVLVLGWKGFTSTRERVFGKIEAEYERTVKWIKRIAEIDEFKGRWEALRGLAPERLVLDVEEAKESAEWIRTAYGVDRLDSEAR